MPTFFWITYRFPSYVLSRKWLHATIPSTHRVYFGPIWSNSGPFFSESGGKYSERKSTDSTFGECHCKKKFAGRRFETADGLWGTDFVHASQRLEAHAACQHSRNAMSCKCKYTCPCQVHVTVQERSLINILGSTQWHSWEVWNKNAIYALLHNYIAHKKQMTAS